MVFFFLTTSGLTSGLSDTLATLASYQAEIASQQVKMNDTVHQLTRSVQSLTDSAIDPAQIRDLTDKLHQLSMESPVQRTGPLPTVSTGFAPSQYNVGRYQQPHHVSEQQFNGQSRFPTHSHFDNQPSRRLDNNADQPAASFQNLNPVWQGNHSYLQSVQTPWGEPKTVQPFFFTGKPTELHRFLMEIRDAIQPHIGRFLSDSCRINWVAQHFYVQDVNQPNVETALQSWFEGLLAQNAKVLNRWSPFSDLKSFDYVIDGLRSLNEFYSALIDNFEDKESIKTANDSLKKLVQGSMKVSEFNSWFLSLVSHVSLSEDSQMEIYEQNLHPAVSCAAISNEWIGCTNLHQKMRLGILAGGMAARYATLPIGTPFSTKGTKWSHSLNTSQVPI